jgi:hypothetical protein
MRPTWKPTEDAADGLMRPTEDAVDGLMRPMREGMVSKQNEQHL